jgi:hypothetical protein
MPKDIGIALIDTGVLSVFGIEIVVFHLLILAYLVFWHNKLFIPKINYVCVLAKKAYYAKKYIMYGDIGVTLIDISVLSVRAKKLLMPKIERYFIHKYWHSKLTLPKSTLCLQTIVLHSSISVYFVFRHNKLIRPKHLLPLRKVASH